MKTKIQIVSDLHREVGIRSIKIVGDVLLLVGDISSAKPSNISLLKEWLTGLDIPILYVLGNHEYYHGDVKTTLQTFRDTFKNTNVRVLNNDCVDDLIEDTVFIGATLWTHIPIKDEATLMWGMNDFRVIKNMSVEWWNTEFQYSKQYIDLMLKNYESVKNKIIITHHIPTHLSIAERFKGNSLNSGFSSDLSELILNREPTIWIHGHTHDSFDYELGKTRIICNPYGYMKYETNPEFIEDFCVEI